MNQVFKVVGMVLLGLFLLAVGIPLILIVVGSVFSGLGFIIHLAVLLIKLAIVIAIIYLLLVGIRSLLR
ncbi:MAG: hypothetical protein ACRD4L_06950 [Pyrinomonadaceae bacterium]